MFSSCSVVKILKRDVTLICFVLFKLKLLQIEMHKVKTMNLAAKEDTKLELEENNSQLVMPQQSNNEIDDDIWGEIDVISMSNTDHLLVDEAITKGSCEPRSTFLFLAHNVIVEGK